MTKPMSKTRMKVGLLMACTIPLSYLAFSPLLASIAQDFPDVSMSMVQMIMTMPNFMFIIFSPLSGIFTRYIRKKTIIEAAVLSYTIGGLLPFFLHSSIWFLLLGSTILGCGNGMLMPVVNDLICDYFDLDERGQLMGLNATFVATGGILFTALSGMLSGFGWHYSYLCFLLTIPVLIVIALCVPDGIKRTPVKGEKKAASGFEMNPYIFALFVIGFLYFTFQNTFNTNSSSYVQEILSGDAKAASLVTISNAIGGIIGGTIFGFIVKKISDQIETLAIGIAALGFFLSFFLPHFVPVLVSSIMIGSGFAFFNAAGTFLFSKNLKPENNAFTVAIYMAIINLGASISPIVVNSVSGIFGSGIGTRFLLCGILLTAVAIYSGVVNMPHKK